MSGLNPELLLITLYDVGVTVPSSGDCDTKKKSYLNCTNILYQISSLGINNITFLY